MAVLRVLTEQPGLHTFNFRAGALRFGVVAGNYVYRLVISIPTGVLRFSEDLGHRMVDIHVSALSLIKDESGQVVRKVSKDLGFEALTRTRNEFQAGETTLILPLDIRPGVYHVETVVIDRLADRASVHRSVLAVPQLQDTCHTSDFVWVRRVDAASGDLDPFNPLDTALGHITPEFDPVVTRPVALRFFFVVYAASSISEKPAVVLSVLRDGKPMSTEQLKLPAANLDGSYSFLESLPSVNLDSGQYDVVVTTTQQGQTALLASQFAVQ